ncbi:MAG TPA: ribosome-associated translation inhibitor RaiA, partial [Candidatus Limnocylindrales bacterium]
MRTIVKGKNIDVPDSVRQYAERKMRRLERLLDESTDALVELSNEQHRSAADSQIAEVTLVVDGQTLRSHAAGPTYQASLDTVIDRIERQAVDAREKPRGKVRPGQARARRAAGEE